MSKFGDWCDRKQLMPTMDNADKFAEECNPYNLTRPEEAFVTAIVVDLRKGRKVLAVTLAQESGDALVREISQMAYRIPITRLADAAWQSVGVTRG